MTEHFESQLRLHHQFPQPNLEEEVFNMELRQLITAMLSFLKSYYFQNAIKYSIRKKPLRMFEEKNSMKLPM